MSGLFNEHTSALDLGYLIETGRLDPRDLARFYLERARELDPEHRIYMSILETRALAEASAAADRARRGLRLGRLDGVPVSWKDLFDLEGAPTSSGSLLRTENIAGADAEIVARATRAGLVALGKTTMTEFAFSGLGINPYLGTPANAFDDNIERVPGGSSSGAAVSVARGLAAAAVGTDTGGSVRIPAAWNGLVGLKTTAGLISTQGVAPLSTTFDSVGPITRDVADAAEFLGLMTGERATDLEGASLDGAVFWLPGGGRAFDELDEGVARAFEEAVQLLVRKGARIIELPLPELDEIDDLAWTSPAPRLVCEAYAIWGDLLASGRDRVYPPVYDRLMAGGAMKAGDLVRTDMRRGEIARRYLAATAGVDAVLLPTVSISPPAIGDLIEGGPAYFQANRRALRNTTMGNQLGLCAITLPIGYDAHGIPVGLMLQSGPFTEKKLLRIARACELARA